MEINFKGPVMPIDPYSQLAFVEILNILLTAGHIVDVNRFLISRNVNPQFGSAFRCPGSKRQRERQGNGKLKMKRYGNYDKNTQPGNRARGI